MSAAAPLPFALALLFAGDAGENGVTVSGAVTDAAGEPVAATVTAVPLTDPAAVSGETGADGRFTLAGLTPGRTKLRAVCDDGRAGWAFVVLPGESGRVDGAGVTVGPVGKLAFDVTAPGGGPAAGAAVAEVWWRTGGGEDELLTAEQAAAFGLGWEPAGPDGRVHVAGLPAGAEARPHVDHPDAFRVEAGPFAVPAPGEPGDVPAVALEAGGRLELSLVPADGPAVPADFAVPADGWELRVQGGGNAGLLYERDVTAEPAAGGAAAISVRLPPGEAFRMLTHSDAAAVPRSEYDVPVVVGETTRRVVSVLPRAEVTGRVVNAAGESRPLAGVYAYTRAPAAPDGGRGDGGPFGPGWAFTGGDYDLDDEGRFAVRAGVGAVRLSASMHPAFGAVFPARTDVIALTPTGADAGEVLVADLPTLAGVVVDAAGDPVRHALVAPGPNLEYRSHTVRADAGGRFAYPVDGLADEGGDGFAADLVAFAPYGPGSAAVSVPLEPGVTPDPLTVTLDDAPVPAPPEPVEGWRAWAETHTPEPGDAAPPVRFSAAFGPDGTEFDDPPTLADLRGRWVLLDLRTTWCAPCRREEPTLAAVAEAYADRLTVLEVYGTSDTAEAVAAYLADRPAAGIVLRDADDGATHHAYAVRGVPTRALIGPGGAVRLHSAQNQEALRPRLADTLRRFLAAEGDGADED